MAAAAILVAGVAYEVFRLFVPWPDVKYGLSATISSVLIVVWTVAAVTLLNRRKHEASASLGWVLTFAAPVLMGVHALATRSITQSWLGLVYVPMALALGFFLKRTWDGREYWSSRRRTLRRTSGSSEIRVPGSGLHHPA